jgi:hypothetical protein
MRSRKSLKATFEQPQALVLVENYAVLTLIMQYKFLLHYAMAYPQIHHKHNFPECEKA